MRDSWRCRCKPGFVHGEDQEKGEALEQVGYEPVRHAVQRWEVEQVLAAEVPSRLRPSALYAAMGLTHEQSATLQGVTARTVRNYLAEVREILDPSINVYSVVTDAVSACLSDRGGARSLPLAG